MQQHGSNYFAPPPPQSPIPPTLGVVSKGQNSTFPEHAHGGVDWSVVCDCDISCSYSLVERILTNEPRHEISNNLTF